jgi:hypothetical protein
MRDGQHSNPAHRIRLRGPWEFVWLSPPSGLPAEARAGDLRLPTTWAAAFGMSVGTVRLSRRFNRPSGLENGERVWLEVAVADEAAVSLNGVWLGRVAAGTARFDVTERLTTYGCIDLDLTRDEARVEEHPLTEACLVIEGPA